MSRSIVTVADRLPGAARPVIVDPPPTPPAASGIGPGSFAEQRDRQIDALETTWADAPGLRGWITTVDHKRIALRYAATAIVFLLLATLLGQAIGMSLATPGRVYVGLGQAHQQALLPMVWSTTALLVVMPMTLAAALYLLPLMLGTRNIALPGLNAFGYWLYLLGGGWLLLALLHHGALALGWTGRGAAPDPAATPMAMAPYYMEQMVTAVRLSWLAPALAMLASVARLRAPGMSVANLPLGAWALLFASVLVLVVVPLATLDAGPAGVGVLQAGLLEQYLAPFQGHVDYLLVVLPVLGMSAMIVETFARRAVLGHWIQVAALLATGIAGLLWWMGPGAVAAVGSLGLLALLALAAALQVACWLLTLLAGRPRFTVPLLFLLGSLLLATLVLAVQSGMVTGALPQPGMAQATPDDSFQHVRLGLVLLFAWLAIAYYWFPKYDGSVLSEAIGQGHLMLSLAGALAVLAGHDILPLLDVAPRVAVYAGGFGPDIGRAMVLTGACLLLLGALPFAFNVYYARRQGRPGGANPWESGQLPWASLSPPPTYNFRGAPRVASPQPLWPLWPHGTPLRMTALGHAQREVLQTSPVAADPLGLRSVPGPTAWPLLCASALMVVLALASTGLSAVVSGAGVALAVATGWLVLRVLHGRRGQPGTAAPLATADASANSHAQDDQASQRH